MPEENLESPLALPEQEPPEAEDAIAAALVRIMDTDPESNIVFGNIPKGEAEDFAAAVAVAEHFGSVPMLRYVNLTNMAKRAERGALVDKILGTIKAIGKSTDSRPGFFGRLRGP